MQNITDSESGVTVSEEPYMADEREASKLTFEFKFSPQSALDVFDALLPVISNTPV